MGTDTVGKQEVEAELVDAATVFTDEVAQSISLGECQHAFSAGLVDEAAVTPVGKVINGDHPGRTGDDEITLFDGTGVGLQDLVDGVLASLLRGFSEQECLTYRIDPCPTLDEMRSR